MDMLRLSSFYKINLCDSDLNASVKNACGLLCLLTWQPVM